jgi:hypothetical protein
MRNGRAADLKSRLSGDDCKSPVAGPNRYFAAADRDVAYYDCTEPLPCSNGNEGWVICCGNACSLDSNAGYHSCVWPAQTPNGYPTKCGSSSSVNNGVLCCKDPPLTGT